MKFDECLTLLSKGLSPCYGNTKVEVEHLIEVGSLVKCLSLSYPKFQQHEVKSAWLTWCGANIDDGTSTVHDKHRKRRKYCLKKWSSFQPAVSFNSCMGDTSSCSSVTFTDANGQPIHVPLFLVEVNNKQEVIDSQPTQFRTIDNHSISKTLKAAKNMTIDTTVKLGDYLGAFSKVSETFKVVGIHRMGCEVLSLESHSQGSRLLTISDLSGLDVTRPNTLANIDDTLVAPVFYLPIPDYANVSKRLKELKRNAKVASEEVPIQREEMEQRGRLLDAMKAREVRNRAEAIRLLKLLHPARARVEQEWEDVGRCLCMSSPDLFEEWLAWTQEHGLKMYPKLYGSGQVSSVEACRERWQCLFRPPTQLDYAKSDIGTYPKNVLQFIDPLSVSPLRTRAMIVKDAEPNHPVLSSLPLSQDIQDVLASVKEGDYLSSRSKVAFRFSKVIKVDLSNPFKPLITVSKTKGFSGGQTISETYNDLGVLWNCWVWRAAVLNQEDSTIAASDDSEDDVNGARVSEVGLLFQLPCTDSETGVLNMEEFLKRDEKRAQEEKEAQLLEQIKRAEIVNAYYAPHFIRPPRAPPTAAPHVVLVKRLERELVIGWKHKLKTIDQNVEAIVEVLCKPDHASQNRRTGELVKFNGSNLVAPLWREQSLVGGVYSSAHVNTTTDILPNTCGWAEIYRGSQNGCKVSKLRPGRTYSFRVRLGEKGAFTHRRFSTLPNAPPPPLILAWRPVPRPNKNPKPSRERIVELVLCGADDWYRNLKDKTPKDMGLSSTSPDENNTTKVGNKLSKSSTRNGTGVFGSSSNRFNGLPGGALNGGGVHSQRKSSGAHPSAGPYGSFVVGDSIVTNTKKKVSVLPHGWTYVVEVQLLSEDLVKMMEEELDDVLGGHPEDFFFRHPLPEYIQEEVEKSSKKRGGGKPGEGEEVVMVKAWKEVCRTRSITSHVHNLIASPPLSGAGRIGSKVTRKGDTASDKHEDGWEVTARELQLRKNRQRFESGYLFVPEREVPVENDPSQSVENQKNKGISASTLMNKISTNQSRASSSKQDKGNVSSQMLPPNDATKVRRMLYVLRSRIENMRDPSIKSAYSSYLLCEAPHVFSEVSVRIPKPIHQNSSWQPSDAFTTYADENESTASKKSNRTADEKEEDPYESFLGVVKSLVSNNTQGPQKRQTATYENMSQDQSRELENPTSALASSNETLFNSTVPELREEELESMASEWIEHWDEKLKRPYFHHKPTGTVQWAAPTHWHALALKQTSSSVT